MRTFLIHKQKNHKKMGARRLRKSIKQYGRIWTIKTFNTMDKILENQASNHAFHCAGVWHNSKQDNDAKRYFESEKKVTLMSYSNRPEFAEKFNAVLAYYLVRENFIKDSIETR